MDVRKDARRPVERRCGKQLCDALVHEIRFARVDVQVVRGRSPRIMLAGRCGCARVGVRFDVGRLGDVVISP